MSRAPITLVTLDWVPEMPRGFVRDIRVRWLAEEIGRPYRVETVPLRQKTETEVAAIGKTIAETIKTLHESAVFREEVLAQAGSNALIEAGAMPGLEAAYGIPLGEVWKPVLEQWERAGLVERDGAFIVLTLAGQFWQVNLSQLLLDYLKRSLEA